ncbi:tandem-95 repeat protein [Stutzerimonas stutzeri]|uniref:tandem-95 repeat protein n=1 Tax=Stutzerimonas stutzeri TaxID=316 RepID=UPI0031329A99
MRPSIYGGLSMNEKCERKLLSCLFRALAIITTMLSLYTATAYADGGAKYITCSHTTACPAGQTGEQRWTRKIPNGSSCLTYLKKFPSGYTLKSDTCVVSVTFSHNSFETRNDACPASHPSGTVSMRRDFEVWSDGSSRNYSSWYETGRNCTAVKTGTSSESQTLACPDLTPSGTWSQTRTFDTWSDGSKKNYSAWSDTSVCYNTTPKATNKTLSIDEDTVGTLVLTATDDHQQITYELVGQPANGVASVNGNKLIFTPSKDWFGTTSLTYRAKDPAGAISNTATVSISVSPINDPPVVQNQSMMMQEDTSATITLPVSDVDTGDTHTFHIVTAPSSAHGIATISGNKVTFTPKPDWNGSTSFTYRARDNSGAYSNTSTVAVTVTPVNDKPSVSNTTLALDEDTVGTLTLEVADVDLQYEGDNHAWSIVTAPNNAHGTASISGNKLSFTPVKDWNGTTTLTYRATDSKSATSNTATITINVRPVNDKAVVHEKTASIPEDTSTTIRLTVSDVDLGIEGDSHTFDIIGTLNPAEGSFSFAGSDITITPAQDWNGTLSLSYRARDSHGLYSEPMPITVEVTYVNDAPTATEAFIPAKEGMASDHVRPSVTDVDLPYGDEHSFEILTQPANGSAKLVYGMLEYTPNPQFFGEDSFTIRATDKAGASVDGVANVVVEKFNYAPTDIVPGEVVLYAGIGGTTQLQATDPNNWGSHTFSVVGQPEAGTASIEGNTLTLRTDDDKPTVIRVKTTDQDGMIFEKDIKIRFQSAWAMFEGREVEQSGSAPTVPAVTTFMTYRNGSYGLQVSSPELLAALGTDIVAAVSPDSAVGVKLEHRDLEPDLGMRLTPTKLQPSYLEAKLAGLKAGVDGTANLYLSRADMSGPIYAIPVNVWTPKGSLQADRWEVKQGLETAQISFASEGSACAVLTSEQLVKPKNVLQEPTCLIEWEITPAEWRDTGHANLLSMVAIGGEVGQFPVRAKAYVFDPKGGKHWIADFSHDLKVVSPTGLLQLGLKPAPEQTYQAVQDLSLLLRAQNNDVCELTTNETIARNAAKNWNRSMCFIRWTALPEGLSQSTTWHAPQVVGAASVLGQHSIAWKASVFTPSGQEVDLTHGAHEVEVIEPPAIEIELPQEKKIDENTYWVSQRGGYVGSLSIMALPASIDLKLSRDSTVIEKGTFPSYGRNQRLMRSLEGTEKPLWSLTPFNIDARFTKLPAVETVKEVQLYAVPHEQILPVILNDERSVLDSVALPVNVQMLDTQYPQDGYNLATMGDWDIRLLMTTAGINYEPVTDWEPINEEGIASFELDLAMLTNKAVRVIAEARVRSPLPGYESIRQSNYPMFLTVLNGEPLDGVIQALRVIGVAPLRNTFYAMTVDRFEAKDVGDVRWEMSTDNGVTWDTVENTGKIPQRLSMTFEKGTYLLRAEMTNRNSGAKSMTPQIEVIAYEVPTARLKGPSNVFIGDVGRFVLTDLNGETLDTTGMVVEWSEDRGETWVQGTGEYELTRDQAERVYLMSRVKFADSPDDSRVYKRLRVGVAFRAVRPPRVQIIGPGRPEVGKEATWRANMMMPYPKMDLTMDGYFILPTGEEVHEREVSYIPTMEDFNKEQSFLGFMGWINGYEDIGGKGLTQQRLIFWSYDWPTWAIKARISAVYSPADLDLQVRSLGLFREFEELEMDWDIPPYPGLEIIKDTSQTSRSLRITEPGTYTFGVHVSDARGNYTYAETELEFSEPLPYEVTLSWSGDNPANRAPLGVLIRPSITGGHPKDRIEARTYTLNGEPLEGSGNYGRAVLDKGEHTVRLEIGSMMGHTASGETHIKVESNIPPSCSIEVDEGRSSWIARASCADEDGRIVRHLWYIDGVQQSLSSSSISIPMWRYPNGEPIVTLIGIDDAGAESPTVANY